MNQFNNNQSGSVQVVAIVLLVIALVGALGFVFWQNVLQPQSPDASTNKSAKIDSRSSSKTEEVSADSNEGYVVLEDWGVRFKPSGTAKISYEKKDGRYWFTTEKMQSFGEYCVDYGKVPLTRMTEKNTQMASPPMPLNNEAKIDGYYYYYQPPQATCSDTYAEQEPAEYMTIIDLLQTIEAKK